MSTGCAQKPQPEWQNRLTVPDAQETRHTAKPISSSYEFAEYLPWWLES